MLPAALFGREGEPPDSPTRGEERDGQPHLAGHEQEGEVEALLAHHGLVQEGDGEGQGPVEEGNQDTAAALTSAHFVLVRYETAAVCPDYSQLEETTEIIQQCVCRNVKKTTASAIKLSTCPHGLD